MNIIMRKEFCYIAGLFVASFTIGFIIGYRYKPAVNDDEVF